MISRTTACTLVLTAAIAVSALGLSGLAPPAFATVESASVVPTTPTVCDSVRLVVAGTLSSPCYTIHGFRVGAPELLPTMGPIPTYRIPVRIRAEEPNPAIGAPCPAVIEPYRLAEELGKLRFGNYWVDATEYVHPFPADSTAPIDSSRIRYTFFVGSDSCRTGEGCVLLGFGATGFDYPRLDGCTARANPGERACFDVTLMNPVPVGALQTEIVIPLRRLDPLLDPSTFLVPVSVIATPRAAGFEAAWTADGSTAKIVLYSTTGAAIAPGRGAVLHVCYAVKAEAPELAYPLRFGPSLVSSPGGEAVPFCPTFAEIEGRICVGVSRCDLNGDGVGDVRDIVRMVRCILAIPSELCPDSLRAEYDCNGDGALDVRDVVCCVRDILTRDGGWGPDPGPSGAPSLDVARVGFEGAATWTNPLEGRAVIAIDGGRAFGGVQFLLHSRGLSRVRDIAIEDPRGMLALQWDVGIGGDARVMVYNRGFIESGAGAASRAAGLAGEVVPIRLFLTLEPVAEGAADGGLAIRSLRGATYEGAALSVEGGTIDLHVPASSVAGVASILPARPNPFLGDTEISFALPSDARASVRLFDVGGRLVRTLHDGSATAGVHRIRWDGRDDRGRTVGVGIYFVHFTSGSVVRTERILRLR
ncbi:MAG: FlgD immunoglobulin-like domain containing protein [Candidatus Eisenbacteria bacterium]